MATPTPSNKFSNELFNKNFDIIHSRVIDMNNKKENETLDKLNNTEYEKEIMDLSISEIIINMFRCWISIFDDINDGNFKNLLTKKHRLFYIGLTIFIIGIILYLFNHFIETDDKVLPKQSKSDNVVNEIRNITINKYYNVIDDDTTDNKLDENIK